MSTPACIVLWLYLQKLPYVTGVSFWVYLERCFPCLLWNHLGVGSHSIHVGVIFSCRHSSIGDVVMVAPLNLGWSQCIHGLYLFSIHYLNFLQLKTLLLVDRSYVSIISYPHTKFWSFKGGVMKPCDEREHYQINIMNKVGMILKNKSLCYILMTTENRIRNE